MTQKIHLNGYIEVPSNKLEIVRDALEIHIALTRQEEGCLSFNVVEDAEQNGRFNVSETFESQEAFDAHQARTKASDWFRVTQDMPRKYQITHGE